MSEDENPAALRLRDITLGHVPWFEVTLSSPASVDDVCARLAARLDNRLWGASPDRPFMGHAAGALVLQRDVPMALGVVATGALPWAFFSWAMRRNGPCLLRLLEDECAATPLPLEEPTTF